MAKTKDVVDTKMPKMTTLAFQLERETKGAVRFQELDEDMQPLESMNDGFVGTLYVRKEGLKKLGFTKEMPSGVVVTLTFKK